MAVQTTLSPHDQSPVVERPILDSDGLDQVVERSKTAQRDWGHRKSLSERLAIVERFLNALEMEKPRLCRQLSETMGRPISQTGGEFNGFCQRARHMASIARSALADVPLTETDTPGKLRRYIRREPLGVVGIVTAWNVRIPKLIARDL
jgi:acyl-CoA reductase-like NAD-dependent aldehyde dehydrogenase